MNWLLGVVAAWIALGADLGLRDALQAGTAPILPSFVLILVIFVATWARRGAALWFALAIGAAADLVTNVATTSGDTITVLGPRALGMLTAGYTAYMLRAWMFRRNAVAVAVMSCVGGCVAGVVIVTLLKTRSAYDSLELGRATSELGVQILSAFYSGAAALLVAPVLGFLKPAFGFPSQGRVGRSR